MRKRINPPIKGMDLLTIGISVPIAISIGFGIGYWLKNLTGSNFLFILFIIIGVAAGIKNLMIAIKIQKKVINEKDKDEKNLNSSWDEMDKEDEQWRS